MNKLVYLAKRIALAIPVVLFGLTMAFLILYAGPLDPVYSILGRKASEADIQRLLVDLGYRYPNGQEVPLWDQYRMVMTDLFTLNFGQSWVVQRGRPIIDLIGARMSATIWLGWWSVVIALLVGIPLGLFAGLRANTFSDYFASAGGILWRAMPNFWLAVILSGLLSAGGALSFYRDWGADYGLATKVVGTPPEVNNLFNPIPLFDGIPVLEMLFLPIPELHNMAVAFKWILPGALVLGSASMGNEVRIARTAVLESINSKYVETARAKGLSARRIVFKHVGRNAMIPLLPVIMGEFYLLIGGSVLVEAIFGINGLGSLYLRAIFQTDIPVIMTLTFIFTIILVVFNITQDLLYTIVDPRISLDEVER